MVEAGAKGVTEQVVLEALEMAHEAIKQLCRGQLELQLEVGREKLDFVPPPFPPQIVEVVSEYLALRLDQAAFNPDKTAREAAVEQLKKRTTAELGERFPEHADILGKLFDLKLKDRVRQRIIEEGVRPDGRGLKDVRKITVEVGVLPRTHGSGLFTRGQTQALTIATLGSMSDQQKLDGLSPDGFKPYMHPNNFRPSSVAKPRPLPAPGRPKTAPGPLPGELLLPAVPPSEGWPYTIRLGSGIL